MNTKRCPKCREIKEVGFFATDKTRSNKLDIYCKQCRSDTNRKKYKENPIPFYDAVIRWEEKNRIKRYAHVQLNYFLRKGRIKKPEICEICNMKDVKLEAHHWHGYDKEHILDVQWLCRSCHKKQEVVK